MSYKEVFKRDKEYQDILSNYKAKRTAFERKAAEGIYNQSHLREEAAEIVNELSAAVTAHRKKRLDEYKQEMDRMEAKAAKERMKVNYSSRPDAKDLEMGFKLANDHELSSLANSLNTDDLLELQLLRMELKNRGMQEEDDKVHRYIIGNRMHTGMDEADQLHYDGVEKKWLTYQQVNDSVVVDGDDMVPISGIKSDLFKI